MIDLNIDFSMKTYSKKFNTFISYPLLMKTTTYRIIANYNWNIINCYLIDWKYYKLDKNNKTKLLNKDKVKIITIY